MRFSTKASEEIAYSGDYLRSIKTGDTKVRFLYDETEWYSYWEHFTADGKKSFPCLGDKETCPGCTDENERVAKASHKYGTNVLLVKSGKVVPMRMPVSIKQKMETRRERSENKTITARDYVLIRQGTGLDTEYDVEGDSAYDVDLETYRKQGVDIESILVASFTELFGDPDEFKPTRPEPRTAPKDVQKDATPPDEVYTEAQIRGMNLVELTQLAVRQNIDISGLETHQQIVDKILGIEY